MASTRREKIQKARSERRQRKLSGMKRQGSSRYARKKEWRVKYLGGCPLPLVFGAAKWEECREREIPYLVAPVQSEPVAEVAA